jgi:hypothetical protein
MKPFAIGAARLAALGFTVSGCIPQPWLASAGPRGYRRNQSKYQFATDRPVEMIPLLVLPVRDKNHKLAVL